MSKRTYLLILFLWLTAAVSPVFAGQKADTTYTFRFVPQKDMFYVPWSGNDTELARLLECIENHQTTILDGKLPIYVDGYCHSLGSEAENLATAKIRANRVKSELIVRGGITEECFITRNHAADGDYVIVTVKVPSTPPEEKAKVTSDTADQDEANDTYINKVEDKPAEEAQTKPAQTEQPETMETTQPASQSLPYRGRWEGVLRANLLRWATLTPVMGLEWRVSLSWGIAVNGSWTSWTWQDNDRRYALWEVMPEVRYYMGKEKRGYLGAMFKAGQFNYKLSATGRQGDLMGGGITGGYQLRLNKALSLDFNVAVGCLHADYEKYEVIDGVRVRAGKETKNWWGPIGAGVTLVWKLF